MELTKQQEAILESTSKKVVVSASAGSGKTFVLVEKLISLIRDKKVPVSKLLVLTFTKVAANEMKSRLVSAMLQQKPDAFLLEQIDDVSVSDISTIDSFCEKIIKRNISKLDIDDGFVILDERSIIALKQRAFQSAFDRFSCQREQFDNIYYAFKKSKDRMQECLFDMQSYFDSLADENVADEFLINYNTYQQKAKKYLLSFVVEKLSMAKSLAEKALTFCDIPEKAMLFAQTLKDILDKLNFAEKDFYLLCQDLCVVNVPDLPRHKCDIEFKKAIARGKECVKEAQAVCENYKDITDKDVENIENGLLAKALLNFYKIYQTKYAALKKARGALDFADIERYAKILLQDDEIKASLQQRYDYIFIDEYQDTNRLQESILKPIAEGGYFTAVGDIKQGIYGFRNASKEIMLQDIADFSAAQDGEALYLTGNFRTDERILSFVNDVFIKIMTLESAGIDYKDKSKLEGLAKFEKDYLPAVSIDIVCPQEDEEKNIRTGVYSVKEDVPKIDDKYKLEIAAIEARIDEVLGMDIYDAKKEMYRKVCQSDIALLFRNRSDLMKECIRHLQSKGYAVEADIKNSLIEDSQIKVITCLLKLCLNLNDDISLAAVMCSPFGGFSLDEITQMRIDNADVQFSQIVVESEDEKVQSFIAKIKEFAFNVQVHGIIKSLQQLFNDCGFNGYLKSLADGREKAAHINELFKLIRSCGFDYKPASVIASLQQNSKQKTAGEGNVDAITATTIHATKGLEYPIVILCGAGESLSKVYNKNYIISSQFGLGSYVYDFANDTSFLSPLFLAGKLKKAKEEFEGELMIFYVALTRAQNHLYIIGSAKQKSFSYDCIDRQGNYLKMIFYALGENFTTQLFGQEQIKTESRRFSIVSQIDTKQEKDKKVSEEDISQKFSKQLKEYQDFTYQNKNICKLNFKNSVTGVLHLEEDDIFAKEYNINEENINKIKNAVDVGNAYHEALKLIDFDKVENEKSFEQEFERIKLLLKQNYIELINKKILYNNIQVVKDLLDGQKVFKEQEFLMKCSLNDVGFLDGGEEKVIVQGIVDFFAIGKKNILIDYKFTSTSNEEILKNRYQKQIQLYTLAIEKAFNIKINEKYLLSLKNSKIIKI